MAIVRIEVEFYDSSIRTVEDLYATDAYKEIENLVSTRMSACMSWSIEPRL